MGLSFGGTQSTSNANATSTPQYSSLQSSLQSVLAPALSTLVGQTSAGGLSPNVQATETGSANQINQAYSQLGNRMNRFLAARGFGQSGQAGQTQLQTELGRQGALATNASTAAGQQLNLGPTYLSDALQLAFANPGSSSTGTTTGSGSGYGVALGGAFGTAPNGSGGSSPFAVVGA
jgi:hypothetical protein